MSEETQVENTETVETQQEKPAAEHDALKALPVDELVNIIAETRSEAKKRRLQNKEIQDKLAEIENQRKLDEESQLEKKNEYQTLYNKLKEETADYGDYKSFKESYLEECQSKVDEAMKKLDKNQLDLFEEAADGKSSDKKLKLIKKLILTKPVTSVIDTTQTTHRPKNGENYTKEELLANTVLMKEVKEKNPTLYNKFFG